MSFEENGKTNQDANIEVISTRKNPMKVLMFLLKTDKLCYITEIAEELGMNWFTIEANLYKLNDARLVEIVETDVDKRLKLWRVVDKDGSEKAIELYKRKMGYKLARFVPYKRITTEQLKSDKRFIETCQEYGLNIIQGISAVLRCPKIGSETHSEGRTTILWRKEEGYIPPTTEHEERPSTKHEREIERTPEQILEEGRRAIG